MRKNKKKFFSMKNFLKKMLCIQKKVVILHSRFEEYIETIKYIEKCQEFVK